MANIERNPDRFGSMKGSDLSEGEGTVDGEGKDIVGAWAEFNGHETIVL